jgi:hypothetical protein
MRLRQNSQFSLHPRQRAVVDALLPPREGAALPWGAFDCGFDAFYAEFRKTAPASFRFGFSAALFVASWLAPFMIGRLPPLARLSPDDRERALEALGRCRFYPLRQCLLLLKAVCSFCYGADARVRAAIGFPS